MGSVGMKRCLGALLALALVGCVGPARMPGFPHARQVPPLSKQVQAVISVANSDGKVAFSGGLVIELKLVNVSSKDATLANELAPGWSVVIEVLGQDGRYVRSRSPILAPARLPTGSHHAVLPLNSFIGAQYLIRPKDPWWKLSPGRYVVRVIYRNKHTLCPVSPLLTVEDIERIGDKSVVPLLTGMIASNVAQFEVVED